jgi:hypothetical protein
MKCSDKMGRDQGGRGRGAVLVGGNQGLTDLNDQLEPSMRGFSGWVMGKRLKLE